MFTVRNDKTGEIIMTAPMSTLTWAFNLHANACTRIQLETGRGDDCTLFLGRHAIGLIDTIRVSK